MAKASTIQPGAWWPGQPQGVVLLGSHSACQPTFRQLGPAGMTEASLPVTSSPTGRPHLPHRRHSPEEQESDLGPTHERCSSSAARNLVTAHQTSESQASPECRVKGGAPSLSVKGQSHIAEGQGRQERRDLWLFLLHRDSSFISSTFLRMLLEDVLPPHKGGN